MHPEALGRNDAVVDLGEAPPEKPSATPASVPVDEFFAGRPDARAVFEKVHSVLQALGPVEVRAYAPDDAEVVTRLREAADRAG